MSACTPEACLTCNQGHHCPSRIARAKAHQRPNPPFFNGRVWIGIAYVPKPIPIESEAVRLQAALLDPRTCEPQTLLQRLFGRLARRCL